MTDVLLPEVDPNDLAAFLEHPEFFTPIGRTLQVPIGERTAFAGSIREEPYQAWITIHQAYLGQFTEIIRETEIQGTPATMTVASGMFNKVKMTVELDYEGETITVGEYLRRIINAQGAAKGVAPQDEATFLAQAKGIGFDFENTGDGQTMAFQHMGASPSGVQEAMDLILSAGGKDVTDRYSAERLRQMRRIVQHASGIEVAELEIGSSNRDLSQYHQGYLDPLDAIVENFLRVLRLRISWYSTSKSLKDRREAQDPDLTEEIEEELNDAANNFRRQSVSWATNWSGAQEGMERSETGEEVYGTGIWYPVQVPCGRITVLVPEREITMKPDTDPPEPWIVNGSPVYHDKREPLLVNGEPQLDAQGHTVMRTIMNQQLINLWRTGTEDAVVPTGEGKEVDTTAPVGQFVGANADTDEQPF